MTPAPLPENEPARLAALRRYEVLDTPPEDAFDDFTRAASVICGAPISLVTLVDEARQWFKSNIGMQIDESPRDISFCGHAICGTELFEVPDARKDERFSNNPFVTGSPNIRFYAGAPLIMSDGQRLGTLCVIDTRPRTLSSKQREALAGLARRVMDHLEVRLATKRIQESEERFARLFHMSPVACSLSDIATGEFLNVNSEFLSLIGRTREEVLGHSSLALGIWGDDQASREKLVKQLLGGEEVRGIERQVTRPDGKTVWASGSARIAHLGGRALVLGTFVDVTARKQAEAALQQLNDQLERRIEERTAELQRQEKFNLLLLENLTEGVVACDAEGRLTLFNRVAREWHGCDPASIPPEQWSTHYNLCDADGHTPLPTERIPLVRAFHGEKLRSVEMSILREGMPTRFVLASGAPLFDAAGVKRGAMVVMHDVTERRQTERQNLRTQRLEAIGTLASGVAHDLNNALAPIMMGVEVLKLKNPDQSGIVDMFESSARRAADMVRQLLTFAKGAEGERVILQPIHLVREMQKLIKGSFPKNIQLSVKCERNLPTVVGDATQLHQILLNLCVNARDAMPNGGTLTIETQREDVDATFASSVPEAAPGNYVVMRVRDTGVGIPPEIVDRIFDPFFTTKGPEKGTGLGLSTVAGIVKGHGGFLHVQSQPNKGSTFSVFLPTGRESSEAEQLVSVETEFRGQGETVLFVDDEATVRNMARAVLRQLNFRPVIATDGVDGLMQMAEHREELRAVITDLHMPEMDGLAFTRALRRVLPDIPVVVASGRLDDAVEVEFKGLGVTHRLDKPFTSTQLAQILKEILVSD
jgi:two-component system, cell cycle sensor histidine kinase and response regulator CckA